MGRVHNLAQNNWNPGNGQELKQTSVWWPASTLCTSNPLSELLGSWSPSLTFKMWCASVQSMRTQSPGHCLFLPLLPCICYTFCRPVLSHSFFICFHCSFLVLYQCEIFRKSSRAPVLSHASLFWALYIMIIKRVTDMVCHPTRVRLPEAEHTLLAFPVPTPVHHRNYWNESILIIQMYIIALSQKVTLRAYSTSLDRLWFESQSTAKF